MLSRPSPDTGLERGVFDLDWPAPASTHGALDGRLGNRTSTTSTACKSLMQTDELRESIRVESERFHPTSRASTREMDASLLRSMHVDGSTTAVVERRVMQG